jgi:hypothetical protein
MSSSPARVRARVRARARARARLELIAIGNMVCHRDAAYIK